MDARDFNRWLVYHGTRFPDTAHWIESLPSVAEVKASWREALADVPLEDAKRVTDAILKGDIPQIENYARERIPSIVREHARAMQRARIEALPARPQTWRDAYRCHLCRDTGFAYVWSVKAMRLMRAAIERGEDGVREVSALGDRGALCAARCKCKLGERRDPSKHAPRLGEYRPLLAVPSMVCNRPDEIAQLREHVENACYARESAFDEWNAQG